MLLGLTYQLVLFVVDLVFVRTRSNAQLRAEVLALRHQLRIRTRSNAQLRAQVLALRHQLRVLERKVGKPAWQPGDRLLLAAISQFLPRSGLASLLPRPETLLRWHRALVRRKWAAFRQRVWLTPTESVRNCLCRLL